MSSFELQLTECDIDSGDFTRSDAGGRRLSVMGYPAGIEPVSACQRLRVQPGEVGADRRRRLLMGTEPLQLRVPGVAAGTSQKNGLGQQGFTPAGDQPLPVQCRGVQ